MKIIDVLLVLFVCVLFIYFVAVGAKSHEWYDKECCSDNDCAPVEEIKFSTDEQGNDVVAVRTKHGFAEGQLKHISIRPSKDDEYHACIITYHAAFIRCLYAPAGG